MLRVALIVLVVLHHLAVIYAANTGFYYLEPAYQDVPALLVLVIFQLLNQAYFMGFFLISGYFTPGSFDRKGAAAFLKDRLVVFDLVLNPLASIGRYYLPANLGGITTPFTWQQYPQLIGIGPMWFVAMLLVFDVGFDHWSPLWSGSADRRAALLRGGRPDSPAPPGVPDPFIKGPVLLPAKEAHRERPEDDG
ncbi:MAG TPA: hypothetical protein VMW65_12355, partial [Chloroflexota bacterium]|nr:hypothetical protein [Chloroflexota bacterium]